jgi:hypothetical protein
MGALPPEAAFQGIGKGRVAACPLRGGGRLGLGRQRFGPVFACRGRGRIAAHCQADTFAGHVNLDHPHAHHIACLDHLMGILDEPVSQLADRFIKNAHEVVKAGDVVRVRVVEVDVPRKRIGLTMRSDAAPAPTREDRAKPLPPKAQTTATPQGASGNTAFADALKGRFGR